MRIGGMGESTMGGLLLKLPRASKFVQTEIIKVGSMMQRLL